LSAVAKALRVRYPDLKMVVAADNDTETEGNPGLTKARAAAKAVGGRVVIPLLTAAPQQ
jgi:putative DNA primase/helicase